MDTKLIIAVLLLSVAHKGRANSEPYTNYIDAIEVLEDIETSVDDIYELGFGTSRGAKYCAQLVKEIRSDFEEAIASMKGYNKDVRDAYEGFKECLIQESPDNAKNCYVTAFRLYVALTAVRGTEIHRAAYKAFTKSLGLPTCMFKKDPQ